MQNSNTAILWIDAARSYDHPKAMEKVIILKLIIQLQQSFVGVYLFVWIF